MALPPQTRSAQTADRYRVSGGKCRGMISHPCTNVKQLCVGGMRVNSPENCTGNLYYSVLSLVLLKYSVRSSSEIPFRDLSGRHYRLYSGDETLSTVYVGTPV